MCGFVLIPGLGSERTLILLGAVSLGSGWVLALSYGVTSSRIIATVAAVLVAISWGSADPWDKLALTRGGHVYFDRGFIGRDSQLVFFHEDTMGGITTVVFQPDSPGAGQKPDDGMRVLLTNGKFQADDRKETAAQTGFALIPILHLGKLEHALVIGLGSGHSAEVVRKFGFSSVGIAEIAPGIIKAAREQFPHINGQILDQSGVELHLEDGRNLLLLDPKTYDLITMEISSVWFAGSTSLYCREFYELCRRRLNPGGIMQQWIQVHHIGPEELGSVIATMREVFPYVSFWKVGGQGILIGSC